MEYGTQDKAAGTLHQLKGKVKEVAGMIADSPKMRGAGAADRFADKTRVKIGQFNQFWGK